MKNTDHLMTAKSALKILFFVFASAGFQSLHAQTDTAKSDTTPPRREIAAPGRENIKANLQTVDNTAPKVYKINTASTVLIGLAATAANIIAINNVLHNKPDISMAEINGLNRNNINGFDQWALRQNPAKRDQFYTASDNALTGTLVLSAATFVLGKKTRKDWLRLGLMFYQTQFLTFAFYDFSPFGPLFQNRYRPVVYYTEFPMELRRAGNQKNSFYSGHVANAAAATFFAVKVYSDYHPEIGNKKYWLYAAASVPPLVTGWLRMKALAHFPSDVLAGYMIGAGFGILIPELHRISTKGVQLNTYYNGMSGGLHMSYALGAKKKSRVLSDFLPSAAPQTTAW